jgi:hypothetical protein
VTVAVLTELVESVIRTLPNSCPAGKNPWQDTWVLMVRKGKYKREHGEAQVEPGSRERVRSALQVLLKPMITYGKGRTR